jgi:hypothetical protein
MSPIAAAERAAAYLVEHARSASSAKLRQGAWDGAFAGEAARMGSLVGETHPALAFLTQHRVRRVPRRAMSGLFAWARGFSVELREDVPRPDEVLALQAKGRRCASLLPDGVSPVPHASGLDFLIHDLCHLDKFVDPEHHEEQVGFFATLEKLYAEPKFHELEATLDQTFTDDRERLGADVNGSAVYLFALLKMKLKMAARRRYARGAGIAARTFGPLDAAERAVFDELEGALYDCLELDAELRGAARATSARRDDVEAAACVAAEFRRRGRAVLAELGSEVVASRWCAESSSIGSESTRIAPFAAPPR